MARSYSALKASDLALTKILRAHADAIAGNKRKGAALMRAMELGKPHAMANEFSAAGSTIIEARNSIRWITE